MINRVVWHWAVSGYTPNSTSLKAYNYVIDGDGKIHSGVRDSGNFAGASMAKGTYAAHTRALNSGSLGISVAAMVGAKEIPFTAGSAPMKENQIEALLQITAEKMLQYGVELSPRTILSHAEVQPTLGVSQAGKWDYMWLPGMANTMNAIDIGNVLRERLSWSVGKPKPQLFLTVRPTIRRGSRGADVFALQTALGITTDSVFGPKTEQAVIKHQRSKQLLPDGIVGRMTWASLGV
jgi:murein L,D-transpeptidase YcbB/YkuD